MSVAWVGAGIGAAGLISGVAGQASASRQARKAQDQNLRLQQETNATNERLFHEGRGSGGHAILPEYFGGTEAQLGGDAAAAARYLFNYGGGPQQRLQSGQDTLRRYQPAIDQGDNLVFDLGSGRVAEGRRASLAPVLQARTGLARGRAAAINDSLAETLAGLRAQRTAQGFRGGSTFDHNRLLAATTGVRRGAATELGQAELDNATALHGLNENDLQMRLAALDLPYTRTQQQLAFQNLPVRSVADQYAAALAPLNFFRLPNANAPYQSAPQVQPIAGNGQIFGAAGAATAQQYGQFLQQQQLMKELGSWFGRGNPAGSYGGGGAESGYLIPGVNTGW